MRSYEITRADVIQKELKKILGGQCAHCGTKRKLEFNHIFRRTWQANRFNRYQRMLKYRRESACNLINLLCENCNRSFRPK